MDDTERIAHDMGSEPTSIEDKPTEPSQHTSAAAVDDAILPENPVSDSFDLHYGSSNCVAAGAGSDVALGGEDGGTDDSGSDDSEDFHNSGDSNNVADDNRSNNSEDSDDEQPPLQINDEALRHIATYFLPGNHGKCTEVIKFARGGFHEIRELLFEDGWSCIGRLARNRQEPSSVLESETATVNYVRRHTSIPVPEIFFVNLNPNHVVGTAFVLMEKLPGQNLYQIFDQLSLRHQLAVIEQIADVLAQLCKFKFDSVGSLNYNGEIGPLENLAYTHEMDDHGPFKTTVDYLTSFLHPLVRRREDIMEYFPRVEKIVVDLLQQNLENPIFQAPYRLIHGDFDGQNMLFEQLDPSQAPQLTGVIDWDQSHSGLLYYLCEYPIFIQDLNEGRAREQMPRNHILRKHFVHFLSQHFPPGSQERRDIKECFRQKIHTLQSFHHTFMGAQWGDPDIEFLAVGSYVNAHFEGTSEHEYGTPPYSGRWDWEPDSELDSDYGETYGSGNDDESSTGGDVGDKAGSGDDRIGDCDEGEEDAEKAMTA